MHIYTYEIKKKTAINRWWLSEIRTEAFESEPSRFDGDINYTEGYVDQIYPVKISFLNSRIINQVSLEDVAEMAKQRLYLPFENNRVEGTGFYHKPVHLSFTGESYLLVDEDCELNFDLYTCGGVKLWLEDQLIETFTPYTRNKSSKKAIVIKMKKGLNHLSVYADELAERDVLFHFELRYMDNHPITGAIQLEESAERILEAEAFLANAHFAHDVYTKGKLELSCKQGVVLDEMAITMSCSEPADDRGRQMELVVGPRTREIYIDEVEHLPMGVHLITLQIKVGETKVERIFNVGIYPETYKHMNRGSSILERKRMVLKQVAAQDHEEPNLILALLADEMRLTKEIETLLDKTLMKIDKREDLSVTYIGLILLIADRYSAIIGDEFLKRIEETVTGFRYWCDEEGDDVMWYFSETHALHFHIAQYLAGSRYPKAKFEASGRRGKAQALIGKERLLDWFSHFFGNGYGDWNAINHMPMNILGFLYLYELCADENIRESAIQCLDFTFRQITYHSYKGVMSTTFGRASEKDLIGREMTQAAYLAWITNGEGFINNDIRTAIVYAFSTYEPEDRAFEVEVGEDEGVAIELNQGLMKRALYSFKTENYMMSSTQNFTAFIPGHQQHLMNIALGDGLQSFINHPGERVVSGTGRPSYWAGNGITPMIRQYRDLMVMRYQIPEDALVHYIHMYLPSAEMDQCIVFDQNVYTKLGDAYMAVKFSHPIYLQNSGPTTGKEIVCKGLNHNIYIRCSSAKQWESFDTFVDVMSGTDIEYSLKHKLSVSDPEYGIAEMDSEGNMVVDNVPVPIYTKQEVMIERTKIKKINV